MATIISIETSTSVCSVALSKDNKLIALKENNEGMKHASLLSVFIEEILKENNLLAKDLDAIAISMGPGSYTGLRIGVSTAKGICFGADIKLIAISTLQAMSKPIINKFAAQLKDVDSAWLCPMIDARRMEVFTAFYDKDCNIMKEISADIIDETSYIETLKLREILFFGDGAAKCKESINHENAIFLENIHPSAQYMIELANEKYSNQEFEDIAYFEPFYLKDFVATTSKKNPLK